MSTEGFALSFNDFIGLKFLDLVGYIQWESQRFVIIRA